MLDLPDGYAFNPGRGEGRVGEGAGAGAGLLVVGYLLSLFVHPAGIDSAAF